MVIGLDCDDVGVRDDFQISGRIAGSKVVVAVSIEDLAARSLVPPLGVAGILIVVVASDTGQLEWKLCHTPRNEFDCIAWKLRPISPAVRT